MTDTNPTRARAAKYKKAFDDVIGDPFSPYDTHGYYGALKHRSLLSATKNNFGESKATVYPAKPNIVDFCVDVERVIQSVLGDDHGLLRDFITTYVMEQGGEVLLTQQERSYIEQRMGKLFTVRGISPVTRYFSYIRK